MDPKYFRFFVDVCDSDFLLASTKNLFNKSEALQMLRDIEEVVDFKLFLCDFEVENVAKKNLTEQGMILLQLAKGILKDLEAQLNFAPLIDIDQELSIQFPLVYGENLILPIVREIFPSFHSRAKKINLFTHRYFDKVGLLSDVHIVFGNPSREIECFFHKRWHILLKQSLYASKIYIKEVGFPKDFFELNYHAILAHGTFAKFDRLKPNNWHVSGGYGLPLLNPTMFLSSSSIFSTAVESGFGIGPVTDYCVNSKRSCLTKIFPEMKCPFIKLEFCIRRKMSNEMIELVKIFEDVILKRLQELEIEVLYY